MKDKLLRQARREYAPRQRMLTLAALAPVFLVLLPASLIRLSARLDQALHLPRLPGGRLALAKGALLAVAGWLLALWTVVVQFDLGRGTPVPLMATQRLVVEPPYTYTRNPMVLGALGLYMGIAVMRRSLSAIGLVLACGAALLVYVRRAEEKEMLVRFGQDYVAYRERTPFLLPRLPR